MKKKTCSPTLTVFYLFFFQGAAEVKIRKKHENVVIDSLILIKEIKDYKY